MSNTSRPHTPTFQFGDAAAHHAFTFADGWVEPSSSPFGVTELRDALPATGPFQGSGEVGTQQNLPASGEYNTPGVFTFGQDRPVEFSLRLLHNARSRDPSPQPPAFGAGRETGDGPLPVVPALPLLLAPSSQPSQQPRESLALVLTSSSEPSEQHRENLTLVPAHARSRSRTSDVSILSDQGEEAPGSATPYDVGNESAPAHRFFTAEFQSTLREGTAIARDTLAEVERLDDLVQGDGDLEKLLDNAMELSAFRGSDTKTIAVLGDSGEGGLVDAVLPLTCTHADIMFGREEQLD